MENQLHILKKIWGFNSLRTHQEKAINHILEGNDVLALLPTGGGKSICYQLPALLSDGVCIVVSPLIALMKDQVVNLKNKGIKAEYINSSISRNSIDIILDNCIYGAIKLLYISPERIQSELFQKRFLKMNVSFVAIDEAHCISQWGYDFRPSYLEIKKLRDLKPNLAVIALTATATKDVVNDIHEKLSIKNKITIKQSFKRSNLFLELINCENKINVVKKLINKNSGIIYVRSRKKSKEISEKLNKIGFSTDFYHAGLDHQARSIKQKDWLTEKTKTIVATSAFGMGIDKANVRFVIHYDLPESLESFYQEAGRAGRDGKPAYNYLLCKENDTKNLLKNTSSKYPSIEQIKKTYQQFCNNNQISVGELPEHSFEVDFEQISERTGLSKKTTFHCFQYFINEAHFSHNITTNFISKIQLICKVGPLNIFLEKHVKFTQLIDVLIRSYSGVFENMISFSEKTLATRTGKDEEKIKQLLSELKSYNIIAYEAKINAFKLNFNSPRQDVNKISLSKIYKKNKQNELYRAQSVVDYCNNKTECRNKIILDYFGESSSKNCNNCDNCFNEIHKKIQSIETISKAIEMILKYEDKEIATISNELTGVVHQDKIKETIKWMMDENKISINSLNQLSLN